MSDELSIPRNPIYRVPRRGGLDRMTRRLLLIAGGLGGTLVLIVALWSSVGQHSGQVPVVQADSRPVRVKPANPGGMQISGLGTDPAQGGDVASADKLAPAPETPDPQALASQTRAVAPPAASQIQPQTQTQPGSATPPAVSPTQPVVAAAVPPAPAAAKPAQIAAAAMPEHRAAPPAGRTQVQLAALGTEAAARQEWDRLAHRMPGVLGARHPVFSKIERDGHTLWRLRTGDFATETEARQFCEQVRANGGGCAVAAF